MTLSRRRSRRARVGRAGISSGSATFPFLRRSSRETFAAACLRRRRSEASRSPTCCATSTRSCCPGRRTGRARASSRTSPTAPPSRGSSRSFSLPRSTRSRSSGAPRRRPPSSKPTRSTGLAQLLGLPSGWHGHIEDTASISTIAALAAARESNGGSVVVCSEEAHSSVERAARLLGLETRKVAARRRVPPGRRRARSHRCVRARRHRRHDVDDVGRSRAGARRLRARPRASGSTSTRPMRARRGSVPSSVGHRRVSSARTRSS